MITFFHISYNLNNFFCEKRNASYNLTGKWNFDIDFFQVLTCCKPVLEFLIFSKTQKMVVFSILVGYDWLTNLSLLFRPR